MYVITTCYRVLQNKRSRSAGFQSIYRLGLFVPGSCALALDAATTVAAALGNNAQLPLVRRTVSCTSCQSPTLEQHTIPRVI